MQFIADQKHARVILGSARALACCNWRPRQLPGRLQADGATLRWEGSRRRRRERHARARALPYKQFASARKILDDHLK